MVIEISTELVYVLIFFLIILAVILFFVLGGPGNLGEKASNVWDSLDKFLRKVVKS